MSRLYRGKSGIDGVGLFTSETLIKHQHVAYIDGPIYVFRTITPSISKKMLDWIGVGKYSWIDTDRSLFRYINHSCDPNVAQVSKRKVIALRVIPSNTELTMDYSLTEAEPDWSISPCACGAKNCRGVITSIDKVPFSTYKKYEQYIPNAFRKIYQQSRTQ